MVVSHGALKTTALLAFGAAALAAPGGQVLQHPHEPLVAPGRTFPLERRRVVLQRFHRQDRAAAQHAREVVDRGRARIWRRRLHAH